MQLTFHLRLCRRLLVDTPSERRGVQSRALWPTCTANKSDPLIDPLLSLTTQLRREGRFFCCLPSLNGRQRPLSGANTAVDAESRRVWIRGSSTVVSSGSTSSAAEERMALTAEVSMQHSPGTFYVLGADGLFSGGRAPSAGDFSEWKK